MRDRLSYTLYARNNCFRKYMNDVPEEDGAPKESRTTKQSRLTSTLKAVGWMFAVKEFNPKNWVKGETFERGSVFKIALKNAKSVWTPIDKNKVRHESFAEARERLGIDDATLSERYQESVLGSRICYFTAILILLFSGYHGFSGNVAGGIGGIFIFVVAAFCGLQRAYLAWRISIERLAKFQEFLRTPDAWFI